MIRSLFVAVVGLLGLVGCAHQETQADVRRELDNQDATIRELARRNEELVARERLLETELETLRAENQALKSGRQVAEEMAAVSEKLRRLEEELGRSGDFTMKPVAGGMAVEVAEILLFETGKATLRPEGKQVLQKLAERLQDFPGNIRVEGHTDNAPVVVHKEEFPLGNLELSGARSLAVAHFLVSAGRLDPGRVSFAGYGEHRPVAENSSAENRARNRRVEIVLLSPETESGR